MNDNHNAPRPGQRRRDYIDTSASTGWGIVLLLLALFALAKSCGG